MTETQKSDAATMCEIWFRNLFKDAATVSIENIIQIVCYFYGKEFVYESDNDGDGSVYWVGTKYGTDKKWKNPAQRGLIRVDSSEWDKGSADAMVANKARLSYSKNDREGAWGSIEFAGDVMVKPTKYTLSQWTGNGFYLRSWVFEGSRDGGCPGQWTLIREHKNDESLKRAGQSYLWNTPNASGYFNRFRVRMTGRNSDENWRLMAHALEIYGFVIYVNNQRHDTFAICNYIKQKDADADEHEQSPQLRSQLEALMDRYADEAEADTDEQLSRLEALMDL